MSKSGDGSTQKSRDASSGLPTLMRVSSSWLTSSGQLEFVAVAEQDMQQVKSCKPDEKVSPWSTPTGVVSRKDFANFENYS
jgi:hypothetical protein